jgi:hypothetical protein
LRVLPTEAATPARYASCMVAPNSARLVSRTTVSVTDGVHATAPAADEVPGAQGAHVDAPVPALNVPAAHAVHATPFPLAVYPAKHVHLSRESLPDAELVPAGQGEH